MGAYPLFFKPLTGEIKTMKIFTNHRVSLATGIILALILAVVLHAVLSDPQSSYTFNVQSFGRWLHIGAGIFWIGLLYYFNAVQVPAVAVAAADTGGPGNMMIFDLRDESLFNTGPSDWKKLETEKKSVPSMT